MINWVSGWQRPGDREVENEEPGPRSGQRRRGADVRTAPCGMSNQPRTSWPLSSAMAPLGALPTAPGCARAYVRSTLVAWNFGHLADMAELVVSEMVTNAVVASTAHSSSLYVSGRVPVTWVRLFSDSFRLVIEVWDQAPGVPVEGKAAPDDESGRGLPLVDALTDGRWGWLPGPPGLPAKCVWAELIAEDAAPGPAARSSSSSSIAAG